MNFRTFAVVILSPLLSWGLTYEGLLLDADGNAIEEQNVRISVVILNEDLDCEMYEREFFLDLSTSKGSFSLDLNNGNAPVSGGHSANTLADVLTNVKDHLVTCKNSLNYQFSGVAENRKLRLTIHEVAGNDIADISLPVQNLEVLPFSAESENTLKLRGVELSAVAPADGEVLVYNSTSSQYEPGPVLATSMDWSSIVGIPTASSSVDGIMLSGDKSKLDGIETGATADQTPSEILSGLADVDGTGSGLDADTIDGIDSSAFLQSESDPTVPASIKDGISWSEVASIPADVSNRNADSLDGLDSTAFLQSESDPTVPASIKDGISWNEVSGKPSLADSHSLDSPDGLTVDAIVVDNSGNVGIGVPSPGTVLDVAGSIRAAVFDAGSSRTIDWLQGNVIYTTASCDGTNFTMNNLLDGGSYTLIIKSASHTGNCTFTGSGISSWRMLPAMITPSGHVVLTFLRAGTDVYVSWINGF